MERDRVKGRHRLNRARSSEDRRSRTRREAVWNRANISPRQDLRGQQRVFFNGATAETPGASSFRDERVSHSSGRGAPATSVPVHNSRNHMRILTQDSQSWVPDSDRTQCLECKKPFGSFLSRRKHHCRLCGEIFCNDCAPIDKKMNIRACDACMVKRMRAMERTVQPKIVYRIGKRARARLSVLSFEDAHRMFRPVSALIETAERSQSDDDVVPSGKVVVDNDDGSYSESKCVAMDSRIVEVDVDMGKTVVSRGKPKTVPPPLPPIPATLSRAASIDEGHALLEATEAAMESEDEQEDVEMKPIRREEEEEDDDDDDEWFVDDFSVAEAIEVLEQHTGWLALYDDKCLWFDLRMDFLVCNHLLQTSYASLSDALVLDFIRQSFKCTYILRKMRRHGEEFSDADVSDKLARDTRESLDTMRKEFGVAHTQYCSVAREVHKELKKQSEFASATERQDRKVENASVEKNKSEESEMALPATKVSLDEKQGPTAAPAMMATSLSRNRRRTSSVSTSRLARKSRSSSYQEILRPVRGLMKTPSGRYVEAEADEKKAVAALSSGKDASGLSATG